MDDIPFAMKWLMIQVVNAANAFEAWMFESAL
jgi:hypothetical protein